MFCKIKCIIFRVKVQIQLCFLLTQASFLDKTIIIIPLQALCQVTAIYLLLYLTPSAEHRTYLPRLYFQEDGKQVSCFTYKLFMVMLKDFSNHWGYLLTIMTHICFGVIWCNLRMPLSQCASAQQRLAAYLHFWVTVLAPKVFSLLIPKIYRHLSHFFMFWIPNLLPHSFIKLIFDVIFGYNPGKNI